MRMQRTIGAIAIFLIMIAGIAYLSLSNFN